MIKVQKNWARIFSRVVLTSALVGSGISFAKTNANDVIKDSSQECLLVFKHNGDPIKGYSSLIKNLDTGEVIKIGDQRYISAAETEVSPTGELVLPVKVLAAETPLSSAADVLRNADVPVLELRLPRKTKDGDLKDTKATERANRLEALGASGIPVWKVDRNLSTPDQNVLVGDRLKVEFDLAQFEALATKTGRTELESELLELAKKDLVSFAATTWEYRGFKGFNKEDLVFVSKGNEEYEWVFRNVRGKGQRIGGLNSEETFLDNVIVQGKKSDKEIHVLSDQKLLSEIRAAVLAKRAQARESNALNETADAARTPADSGEPKIWIQRDELPSDEVLDKQGSVLVKFLADAKSLVSNTVKLDVKADAITKLGYKRDIGKHTELKIEGIVSYDERSVLYKVSYGKKENEVQYAYLEITRSTNTGTTEAVNELYKNVPVENDLNEKQLGSGVVYERSNEGVLAQGPDFVLSSAKPTVKELTAEEKLAAKIAKKSAKKKAEAEALKKKTEKLGTRIDNRVKKIEARVQSLPASVKAETADGRTAWVPTKDDLKSFKSAAKDIEKRKERRTVKQEIKKIKKNVKKLGDLQEKKAELTEEKEKAKEKTKKKKQEAKEKTKDKAKKDKKKNKDKLKKGKDGSKKSDEGAKDAEIPASTAKPVTSEPNEDDDV